MQKNHIKRISALVAVAFVVALMFVSGPVSAMNISMTATVSDNDGDGYTEPGETVTITANISIENGEHVPITNITLDISGSNTMAVCRLPQGESTVVNNQTVCQDSAGRNITLTINMTKESTFGYGYAYGYLDTFNGTGYGYYWTNVSGPDIAGTILFNETGYGYGYSGGIYNSETGYYDYGQSATWFKYTITFTAPSAWSTGSHTARVLITMPDSSDSGTASDEVYATSTFTLSQAAATTTTTTTTTTLASSGGGGGASITPITTTQTGITNTATINELLTALKPADLGLTSLTSADVNVYRIGDAKITTQTVTLNDISAALEGATTAEAKAALTAIKNAMTAGNMQSLAVSKTLDVYKVTGKTSGTSVYVSKITLSFTASSAMENVKIVEVISKTVAASISDLIFPNSNPTTLQSDPIVQWSFSSLKAGEKIDLSYLVKKQLTSIDSTTVAVAAAGITTTTVRKPVCGDGICDAGEEKTCPKDCETPEEKAKSTLLWIVVLIALVAVVVAVYHFGFRKQKPAKKTFRPAAKKKK